MKNQESSKLKNQVATRSKNKEVAAGGSIDVE